jgi:hypothetical protein
MNSVENVTTRIEDNVNAALGRDTRTHIYDILAFQMPSGYIVPGSRFDITDIEVQNYLPQQLARIILAESDSQFNALYEEFVNQLDRLGLRELDAHMNIIVQQNFERLGYRILPIN